MSALIKGFKLANQISNRSPMLLYTTTRNHWNKDFKPAPYPKTEEERVAAAKKYNLLPEEYKPYPDDGMGYGDYPHLPDVSADLKDPYYPYDLPDLKRNFNEPVHAEIDYWGEDRVGPEPTLISGRNQLLAFSGVMIGCFALYLWLEDKRMYRPAVKKQLPGDGKVHYTFERN
ncbi:NADH dehydrogenase [ubiquinone] 1 beta subcomplex subunit 8, mitochondrial [Bradysia coprophila]|uniref:NADH dehydrogenase [ubiquinone] 1 beta subcomplex subunit 8, mitochondrial n=1 Tax=Bradysia coprophila TaxID=38358 RepID=UPI00187D8B69|nr:NADH dehydrogenase [ubiquinone] 1 beta subcomplex subunit 8, mitochondrial [Bradysia coprophila]